MALVRDLKAKTSEPNKIALEWVQPVGFNSSTDEIIVTKTTNHFPTELFDTAHPTKATDSRPIEIFRGSTIVGLDPDSVSVLGQVLTDTLATFPTSPPLNGRLLRDSSSRVFRVASNTATTITVEGSDSPIAGKYIILAEFPICERIQQNFEVDSRTLVGPGVISNLVEVVAGSLLIAQFAVDELVNFIFKDGADNRFIVKNNSANALTFFLNTTFSNTGLETYTYTPGTGVIQYGAAVDLSGVKVGHKFEDSAGARFEILFVNDGGDNITLATGLTVDTTAPVSAIQGQIVVIPVIGVGMALLNNFNNSQPLPYIDNFRLDSEAAARVGTQLLDNTFYYYTAFSKPELTNAAQADFATIDSGTSTQSSAISVKDRNFENVLFNFWPAFQQELDSSGDLEDLMKVFGFQFNEIHSLIETYRLQDSDRVFVNALVPLSEQFGLPSIGFSIGSDTMRRIARDLIAAWKLKGSKEGIFLLIKILTTWDITNGTGDFSAAISDFLPNINGLRFFDVNLGALNTRITETDPLFVAGGRFAKSLPGIVIPGFFTFREFVINIPNVAITGGASEGFSVASGETTMTDTANNFGATNSLIGNFLIPNQEEINDIFEIVSNTSTSVTVRGIVNNKGIGGNYVILSPLNTNRFIILNQLLPLYIPFGTRAGFNFEF